MCSSRRVVCVVLLLVVLLAVACRPTTPEPGIEDGLSPTPPAQAASAGVSVLPGPTEKILISTEDIPQPNCEGSAEKSDTVERSHTVLRTLDLGTQITVDANGQAGIPGVGQVGVGVAVASFYQVSYGSQDTVTRSVTVKAKEGTSILHTIRQYEIWETGEVLITAGGVNQSIPYRFRKDFSMETLEPANVGCPGQGVQLPPAGAETGVEQPSGQSAPVQPAVTSEQPPAPTAAPSEVLVPAFCPFLTNSHIEQLQATASVSDALRQAEALANHQQNDYTAGSTLPAGVIIATDLQNSDLTQFPVSPIRNQGGWGLFVSTAEFIAPNGGTYWCIQ